MDYRMAMKYIDEKNKLGIVPGLDNVKELLRRLGNPQNEIKCLHIAGTNGKGSIFSYMEDILLKAGCKVGRYISPTIFTYLERFQIDKRMINESEFAGYIERISIVINELEQEGFSSPTAFEIETALAYLYFMDNDVDFALIECGMGGRLDATNVIDRPIASVIASVSRDHMQFLGNTLEEIAENKAGIIKADSLCVSYPQEQTVCEILRRECESRNTELIMVDNNEISIICEEPDITRFTYKGKLYEIGMPGAYQVLNVCVAIELAELLTERGIVQISCDIVKKAVVDTFWPGRLTKIKDKPLIYVDGAHNEKAWILLKEYVNKHFTNRRIIYIIGVLKDKEYKKMLDILCPAMYGAVTVTPPGARGLDKELLAGHICRRGIPCEVADDTGDALNKAILRAGDDGVIMVCGSLSFISEYLSFYKEESGI